MIVVGTVGKERNLERNPGQNFLEPSLVSCSRVRNSVLRHFFWISKWLSGKAATSVFRTPGHLRSGPPHCGPRCNRDGDRGCDPRRGRRRRFVCLIGAQRIVNGNKKFLQLKGLNDQDEKRFEEGFGTELQMREESVKTGSWRLRPAL